MMSKKECALGGDMIQVGPQVSPDGTRQCIRHTANHEFQTGFIRPLREGEPVHGEVLFTESLGDGKLAVLDSYTNGEDVKAAEKSGPAQVSTPAYRDGWDRIFGGSRTVGVA